MNPKVWTFLAQGTPQELLNPGRVRMPRDELLLIGAVAILTFVIAGWAFFFRKREDGLSRWRVHRHRRHMSSDAGEGSGHHHHHHRRRRRRREHRPRNPTLAETGGLPPARPDLPPESTP